MFQAGADADHAATVFDRTRVVDHVVSRLLQLVDVEDVLGKLDPRNDMGIGASHAVVAESEQQCPGVVGVRGEGAAVLSGTAGREPESGGDRIGTEWQ